MREKYFLKPLDGRARKYYNVNIAYKQEEHTYV